MYTKQTLFSSIIISVLLVPLFAQGDTGTTTATTTAVVIKTPVTFTMCAQEAIETRDTSIAEIRQMYNEAMKRALLERKEALKEAVALEDTKAQTTAKKAAYNAYKLTQKNSQKAYSSSRKVAWASFDLDMKDCRDARKIANEKTLLEKKKALEIQKEVEKRESEETEEEGETNQ